MSTISSAHPRSVFFGVPATFLAASLGLAGGLSMALLASESSPVLGLIGFFGILGAIGMVLSPTLSLVVVAASLPLERLGRITEDTAAYAVSVSRIVGLFALAAFLLFALFRRWRIHFGAPLLLYTGYTVIAAITMIYTNVPEETNRDVLRIIGNLLFFFYVINAMRSFQLVKLALIVWMAASAGTGLYSMYDYYYGNSETIEEGEMGLTNYRFSTVVNDDSESRTLGVKVKRAFGTTSHPTLFGLNLTMTLPFFAWMIAFQPWRWKIVSFPGFVVVCYNIVLSNTRAVMVLALLSLIFIGIRGLFRITPQMLLGMLLLGAAVLPFIPGDVFMRTLDPSLYTTAKSDSIRIRFKYWQKSVELAEQNWWTGIGVGDQTTIVDMVTDELSGRITPGGLKASAHNEFLWSLVEVGIIGWAFHWAFVGWVIWASFKAASWFRRWEDAREEYWLMIAGQIMLVGVVLFGIQTEVFHFGLKGWWMMAGITYAMYEMARRRMVAQALEDVHGNQG